MNIEDRAEKGASFQSLDGKLRANTDLPIKANEVLKTSPKSICFGISESTISGYTRIFLSSMRKLIKFSKRGILIYQTRHDG
jgi:hypothetical protein